MPKVSSSIAILLVTLLLGHQALANASVASSTSITQAPKKEKNRFSGFLYLSRSTSLYDHQDGTRKNAMDYILRTNYQLNKSLFARLQGAYSQNLEDSTFNDFDDTTVSLYGTPSPMTQYLLFSYHVGVIAPTSKISRETNTLQTALKTGITAAANPDRLISGLNITGSLIASKNFHEYETTKTGSVNTSYSSVQTLSFSYDLPRGFSISADFNHKNTWSYQEVMKDAFEMSQEVNYQINPTFNVAFGHTNGGSIYKPNGTDSNIAIMNEENSVVYFALTSIF